MTILEDAERITRRVFGGAYPFHSELRATCETRAPRARAREGA